MIIIIYFDCVSQGDSEGEDDDDVDDDALSDWNLSEFFVVVVVEIPLILMIDQLEFCNELLQCSQIL